MTYSEREMWADFGRWVAVGRRMLGVRKTEAAKLAGFSPSTWSTLEAGGRVYKGEWVLPSPSDETLLGVARALKQTREEVFRRAGRKYEGPPVSFTRDEKGRVWTHYESGSITSTDIVARVLADQTDLETEEVIDLVQKVAHLDGEDRIMVVQVVDRLLELTTYEDLDAADPRHGTPLDADEEIELLRAADTGLPPKQDKRRSNRPSPPPAPDDP